MSNPGERSPQDRVNSSFARLMMSLHRCEHGRHGGDECLGCGGSSTGNLLLPPGTVIGHTLYGNEIVVPALENHNDPLKWVRVGPVAAE